MIEFGSILPAPGVLAAYSVACFVLFITPGPDMSLTLAKTLAGGRRSGLAAMAGATAGCLVHTMLAAFGLSALIAASPAAFAALKIVGALYLLWLAVDAIRNGSALRVGEGARADEPVARTFALGLAVNLTNPKVVLFFVTFLPQFVDAADPHAAGKLVFLGLYFLAFTTPFGVALVLVAARMVGAITRRPRLMRGIDYLFAAIFGAFAARIALLASR